MAEREEKLEENEQTENEATANEAAKEEPTEKTEQKKKSDKAKEEIDKLKKELEEEKDKYLRLAAEYDNYRKRSAKEKDGIYSDAISDIIKEVLPIFDNLERAAIYESAEKVAEGLAITAKGIDSVLAKVGVEKFGEKGEVFDPNIHNAVLHIEDEALGEGVIAEVFQTGYRIKDKIIRYAMVKVAN